MTPREFRPVEGRVALEEATAGVYEVEGCESPAPHEFRPVECGVALEEATGGVDKVEGCEGCEAPANDEGVDIIAKGSWEHKKLRA
jgi:hypothetical protein